MQRRYRTKKYYCGDYLEVAIYPVYTYPKKRGKRSKPTTEIQQRRKAYIGAAAEPCGRNGTVETVTPLEEI